MCVCRGEYIVYKYATQNSKFNANRVKFHKFYYLAYLKFKSGSKLHVKIKENEIYRNL